VDPLSTLKPVIQTLVFAVLFLILFVLILPPLLPLLGQTAGKSVYGFFVVSAVVIALRLRHLARRL
jgi:hypothetical protein